MEDERLRKCAISDGSATSTKHWPKFVESQEQENLSKFMDSHNKREEKRDEILSLSQDASASGLILVASQPQHGILFGFFKNSTSYALATNPIWPIRQLKPIWPN